MMGGQLDLDQDLPSALRPRASTTSPNATYPGPALTSGPPVAPDPLRPSGQQSSEGTTGPPHGRESAFGFGSAMSDLKSPTQQQQHAHWAEASGSGAGIGAGRGMLTMQMRANSVVVWPPGAASASGVPGHALASRAVQAKAGAKGEAGVPRMPALGMHWMPTAQARKLKAAMAKAAEEEAERQLAVSKLLT